MMKAIVKFFTGLFLHILCFDISMAQTCAGGGSPLPCNYTPDWQWVDANTTNWEAKIGASVVSMGSPFISNTNTNDMITIIDGLDYLPTQGWVLLAKDFGCINGQAATHSTPYFILYNKYRSIIRLFLYLGNVNYGNRANVILRWNSPSVNNSLLTISNDFMMANDNYPLGSNTEKHVNYLNQVTNSGGWVTTEFAVNFDPNTVNSAGNFQRITFDFNVSTASFISLSGDFNFSTESATPRAPSPPTVNSVDPTLLDYLVTAKAFLGKVPKVSELSAGFNSISAGTDTINKLFHTPFTRDLKRFSDGLNNGNFKKFLIGAATASELVLDKGYLDIAASILELFIGKSNTAAAATADTYVQPTVSKGTINLNGTIVTSSTPLSISVQLPGTAHKYSNGEINCPDLPVYDCPLGLIGLQEAPDIEMKTHSFLVGSRIWTTDTFVVNHQPQFYTVYHGDNIREQYNSYKVTSNLELALNGAVGVNIQHIKAALVAVQDPNIQPLDSSYALISDRVSENGLAKTGYNELTVPANWPTIDQMTYSRSSPERAYIANGTYVINTVDQAKKKLSYSTPFIDIDKFENTVIVAQPGMKILLKLQVVMMPTDLDDDQTPIIYVLTYDLSNKITDVGSPDPVSNGAPPAFTCSQLERLVVATNNINGTQTINSGLYGGIYMKTNNAVTVNANTASNVNFKGANRIQMTPGFVANATGANYFRAYLDKTGQCPDGTDALTLPAAYFTNCTPSATDRRASHYQNESLEETPTLQFNSEALKMFVAPNPNSGNFRLFFNHNVGGGKVRIINTLNQEIYSVNLEDGLSSYEIDLEKNIVPGTYYVLWNNSTFALSQKFILE